MPIKRTKAADGRPVYVKDDLPRPSNAQRMHRTGIHTNSRADDKQ